jgi:hypothetical protein
MILVIPHRHDLVGYLFVNKAIRSLNYKLKNVAKIFNYVSIMECIIMKYFTKHSMNFNRRDKRLVSNN